VSASGLLCTLSAEELSENVAATTDSCAEQDAALELSFAGCTTSALLAASFALSPGGLPLSFRWTPDDREGLATAVSFLRCTQFLDIPILSDAACDDMAAVLAHRCADGAQVAALFGVGDATEQDLCGPFRTAGAAGVDIGELLLASPMLGYRGRCFIAAWATESSTLSQMPFESAREVLSRADAMVREDAGVRELLAAAGVSGLVGELSTSENMVLSSSGSSDAIDVPWILLSQGQAITVVKSRCVRYRGSSLLTLALAAQAVPEIGNVDVRMQSVQALGHIACSGDEFAKKTLQSILGAAQFLHRPPKHDDLEGDSESPAAAAARRWGLDDASPVRTAACEVLGKLGGDDGIDTAALESVSGLADHRNFDVRQAVTVMLGRIAKPGDVVATEVLIKALGDDDWHVRGAAVMAICQFAGRRCVDSVSGEAQLIPAICARLTDLKSDVRQSVRGAIAALTSQGGPAVARVVIRSLIHAELGRRVPLLRRPSADVRSAVVEAIGDAVKFSVCLDNSQSQSPNSRNDGALEEGVRAICGCLSDRSDLVRRAVLQSLNAWVSSEIPGKVSKQIMELAIAAAAADSSGGSSEEALHVLGAVAQRGDELATEAACKSLSSPRASPKVRLAAVTVLGQVAAKGNAHASTALVRSLCDPDVDVERAAFHALKSVVESSAEELADDIDRYKFSLIAIVSDLEAASRCRGYALQCLTWVAHRGESATLTCAMSALTSADSELRCYALGLIARVAEPGDAVVEDAVVARLSDSDVQVCERALGVCEVLINCSDGHVVDAIAALVVSPEYCVRQTGLRTLLRICGRGNNIATSRVLPWLDTGHWPQRRAALEALLVIAAPGDPEVLKRVLRHTDDNDALCRQMACEVLSKVAVPGDQPAIEALIIRIERDHDWVVREASKSSLKILVTSAEEPSLVQLVNHPDEDIAKAVQDVLMFVGSSVMPAA
jgi:HEAT repeat protein